MSSTSRRVFLMQVAACGTSLVAVGAAHAQAVKLDEKDAQAVAEESELAPAAAELHARYGTAVLLKGGHLRGTEAVDWLHHAEGTQAYRAPFIPNVSTHGTGCTYAAAITSRLALGDSLPVAVAAAKHYVSHAIRTSFRWNEVQALNHFLVP